MQIDSDRSYSHEELFNILRHKKKDTELVAFTTGKRVATCSTLCCYPNKNMTSTSRASRGATASRLAQKETEQPRPVNEHPVPPPIVDKPDVLDLPNLKHAARPSRPKSDPHHYADFHQYISEIQILHECASWIHAKGEIIARIGQVPYLRNKSSTCLQLSWSKPASSTMYVHGGAIIPPKLSHLPCNLVQHIIYYIWATYSSTAKSMLESCVA